MNEITVTEIKVDTNTLAEFFGTPSPFLSAKVTLADGTVVRVSQYANEAPEWGADSLIRRNGFPSFVHGAGERLGINVGAVNEEIRDAVNAAVVASGVTL